MQTHPYILRVPSLRPKLHMLQIKSEVYFDPSPFLLSLCTRCTAVYIYRYFTDADCKAESAVDWQTFFNAVLTTTREAAGGSGLTTSFDGVLSTNYRLLRI